MMPDSYHNTAILGFIELWGRFSSAHQTRWEIFQMCFNAEHKFLVVWIANLV